MEKQKYRERKKSKINIGIMKKKNGFSFFLSYSIVKSVETRYSNSF
jgi:hypothetical protein